MRTTRRAALLAVPAVLAAVLATVLPAQAATGFSTSAKSAADPNTKIQTQIWRVRTGNDGSFDRIVFDQRLSSSGYQVRYVKQVTADPSGKPVAMQGRYFLQVSLPDSGTTSASGMPSYVVSTYTPGLPEVMQIKRVGEFERVVSFGIGLRNYRGFRVLRLASPARLVIDVLH